MERSQQQLEMSVKDFQILNKIGDGAFSVVYKVRRHSDGLVYALKKAKPFADPLQVKMGQLSVKEKEGPPIS